MSNDSQCHGVIMKWAAHPAGNSLAAGVSNSSEDIWPGRGKHVCQAGSSPSALLCCLPGAAQPGPSLRAVSGCGLLPGCCCQPLRPSWDSCQLGSGGPSSQLTTPSQCLLISPSCVALTNCSCCSRGEVKSRACSQFSPAPGGSGDHLIIGATAAIRRSNTGRAILGLVDIACWITRWSW